MLKFFAKYRKAWAAVAGTVVAGAGALSSLQFVSGSLSHNLAVGFAAAIPVLAGAFPALAPANATTDPPTTAEWVTALRDDFVSVVKILHGPNAIVTVQTPSGVLPVTAVQAPAPSAPDPALGMVPPTGSVTL